MTVSSAPTLAGFGWFITNIMGINAIYLPVDAPVIGWSLAVALDIVNPALRGIGNCVPGLPATNIYTVAVYNLAGSTLVNLAPDEEGRTYFAKLREKLGIDEFTPGVVSSTGDSSTSESLLNPDFMKGLTLANLAQLKDPWGRAYLQIAQRAGPTIWGLS